MIIQHALTLTDQLLNLLMEEKKYLLQRKVREASLLLDDKEALMAKYTETIYEIKENLLPMKQFSSDLAYLLQEKTMRLKNQILENEYLISIATEANNRILNAIINMASDKTVQIDHYSPLGKVYAGKTYTPPALAIDHYI